MKIRQHNEILVSGKSYFESFYGDHTGGLLKLRKTYMKINPKSFSTVYVADGFFEQRYDIDGNLRGFMVLMT